MASHFKLTEKERGELVMAAYHVSRPKKRYLKLVGHHAVIVIVQSGKSYLIDCTFTQGIRIIPCILSENWQCDYKINVDSTKTLQDAINVRNNGRRVNYNL